MLKLKSLKVLKYPKVALFVGVCALGGAVLGAVYMTTLSETFLSGFDAGWENAKEHGEFLLDMDIVD